SSFIAAAGAPGLRYNFKKPACVLALAARRRSGGSRGRVAPSRSRALRNQQRIHRGLLTMTTTMTTPQMKERPTPRAEDTRRRIYESALKLFREKGFEQTTMRDIAAKAGVALGAAYYYFSSKEAIVLAFYQEMQESSHDSILEALSQHKKLK